MTVGFLLVIDDSMEKFYEDFIKEWKKIRIKVGPNNDKIVEELKKIVDFKNLTSPNKIIGKGDNK